MQVDWDIMEAWLQISAIQSNRLIKTQTGGNPVMKCQDILSVKGTSVEHIHAGAKLDEVVHRLVEHGIGSLLVMDGDSILGIITERDILRTCEAERRALSEIAVDERMTCDPITCRPEDAVADVMGLMTNNRVRHLPVVEDGQLFGMISIGDVVNAQYKQLTVENHYLKNYIQS